MGSSRDKRAAFRFPRDGSPFDEQDLICTHVPHFLGSSSYIYSHFSVSSVYILIRVHQGVYGIGAWRHTGYDRRNKDSITSKHARKHGSTGNSMGIGLGGSHCSVKGIVYRLLDLECSCRDGKEGWLGKVYCIYQFWAAKRTDSHKSYNIYL